jgi:transcriptional regulator with XRE-family HTH domain
MSRLIGDSVTANARQIMRATRGDVPRSKIAQRLGEGREWARLIESGKRRMTLGVFVDWCGALGVDPVDVLRDAMGDEP